MGTKQDTLFLYCIASIKLIFIIKQVAILIEKKTIVKRSINLNVSLDTSVFKK